MVKQRYPGAVPDLQPDPDPRPAAGSDRHGAGLAPSPWVVRFAGLVPPGGAVLDVAAGYGRHARLFLSRGHRVTALERDPEGLADLAGRPDLEIVAVDLETGGRWPLGERRFAGVVVTNYLYRPLMTAIVAAVAPGGVLIYETFAQGNAAFGKPSNPDFLLRPGELIAALAGRLRVLAYEDLEVAKPRAAMVQRIVARAPPSGRTE
ncbi:MAG: class I SAM-dependent methyltransferase [Pseudomonadota bacterium]